MWGHWIIKKIDPKAIVKYYLICYKYISSGQEYDENLIPELNYLWNKIEFNGEVKNIWIYPIHWHFDSKERVKGKISIDDLTALCCKNISNSFIDNEQLDTQNSLWEGMLKPESYDEIIRISNESEIEESTFFPIW